MPLMPVFSAGVGLGIGVGVGGLGFGGAGVGSGCGWQPTAIVTGDKKSNIVTSTIIVFLILPHLFNSLSKSRAKYKGYQLSPHLLAIPVPYVHHLAS